MNGVSPITPKSWPQGGTACSKCRRSKKLCCLTSELLRLCRKQVAILQAAMSSVIAAAAARVQQVNETKNSQRKIHKQSSEIVVLTEKVEVAQYRNGTLIAKLRDNGLTALRRLARRRFVILAKKSLFEWQKAKAQFLIADLAWTQRAAAVQGFMRCTVHHNDMKMRNWFSSLKLNMFAKTSSRLWQCGMRRLCQIMLQAFRIEMQLRIKLWHSAWKAERLLRRAGARMLHKEAMHALQAFRKHFQNVKQADQAEQRMRRVGARMLNKEVVFTLQGFRRNLSDAKQAERAERTMRRVGARMLHKEAVFALQGFRRNLVDAKQAERAERIMRQVGARMLNKEVVFVLQTFRRKLWLAKQAERAYKIGIQQLCQMILRVSQGEMGLRIGLWHSALKVWKTERLTAMKAAADAQERKLHGAEKRKQMKKKQYMAVKALTMCMGRKDKDKMREWLALARLNQSECEHASLLTESMSRAGHQQLQTAAGCLSHVLSRLRQGMTRFCVQNWHDTTKAWALRQSFLKSHLKKLAEVNAAHQAEIKVKQARGLVRCMKHVDNRNQEKWIDRVKLRMVKSNCEQTMEKLTGEMSAGGGDMLSHA